MFPLTGVTVKIGAIEQRSQFQLPGLRGDYIGIELGADASADLNLDDFMVFDNDEQKATAFFRELLFRHVKSIEGNSTIQKILDGHGFVQQAFTQKNVFEEFVRASEGVPRDGINILALAAQKANEDAITIETLRAASKTWYQRDKETPVSAHAEAQDLMHWIIDKVIGHRRARAFLLRSNAKNDLVDSLFDARVLHVLKRNIAAHDEPGVRYNVYKIDYGCYVDLLTTKKAPAGLLPSEKSGKAGFVDVPPDDYRAIRRAILNIGDFKAERVTR